MYPDEFEYHRASTVEEALDLLDEYPAAEILAGGHSLLPTMKSGLASPDHLVDIGHIDSMRGIDADGDTVSVGALTTYADVADSDVVREHASIVAETVHEIGDVQVRNRGTVGGNVAHADPASDLPGAMLAADATMVAHGPDGSRTIPVDDFFLGMYETALAEDELLTGVELPSQPDVVSAYAKKPSPSSGYAMVGVAVALSHDGGVVGDARVGANGVIDHGVRLEPVEEALEGEELDADTVENAAQRASVDDEWLPMEDLQASAEFREQLLRVYTERALTEVAERAGTVVVSA
ncbi:xanthine dehydrogenase family protein subunit M [Salinigranum rubrum]|uniref:Xanthine dehydrogenase family protein subunit M n=1 Tax=Salinigranum rubrum TaxID=755307 RepID=A0A2I8VN79_9EURY|nr:xanthine dehydrogenase family protein subunit M [Salinigranum rubrum]AUV83371.1 xanthine dehydrogenase family protein subunit M [Salinigranum rubrum]